MTRAARLAHEEAPPALGEWGGKAEVLQRLRGRVTRSRILPQVAFTVARWRVDRAGVLASVAATLGRQPVIVRSSARNEDGGLRSEAGRYASVPDVDPADARGLAVAIGRVIASYDTDDEAHQVLVQPMLTDVALSGVALTRDADTLAPYDVVNFDDSSGRPGAVTSGHGPHLRTRVHLRSSAQAVEDPRLAAVHGACRELEQLTGCDHLDVEFAVTRAGEVVTLQVRPLVGGARADAVPDRRLGEALASVRDAVTEAQADDPLLLGRGTLYGVMPDWNPAEMLGLKPRKLAVSLYRTLITDRVWAEQRAAYGYRDVRGRPLLVELAGVPFVDVRVDFNSFVPADLEEGRAARLVNAYLDRLRAHPAHHDKVEFEVVFSCHTFDLRERVARLEDLGFDAQDGEALCASLARLTRRIVHPEHGLYVADRARARRLPARQARLVGRDLPPLTRVHRLLSECRTWGTLPFAGLARAAFVAVEWLRGLERLGVVDRPQSEELLGSVDTVTTRLRSDAARLARGGLARSEFLRRYGHLRPGTYNILSRRYDEALADYFFSGSGPLQAAPGPRRPAEEVLSAGQRRAIGCLLKRDRLGLDTAGFLRFVREAVAARESAKFHFSRSVSEALRLLAEVGEGVGLSRDDLSHLDVETVLAGRPPAHWRAEIERNRDAYRVTERVRLPPLIRDPDEAWSFELGAGHPTFVTRKSVVAPTVAGDALRKDHCAGRIVMLESADPGYDWIFTHRIAGLVTLFGGPNSHMALRASELGTAAVIGCGETRYRAWSRARVLEIDAAHHTVNVVR